MQQQQAQQHHPQQQQQHLMQMNQNMVAGGYASPATVTTDLIQQYLDENKQLILAILDNQSAGKVEECARNQARLQHNLMYLAAIADSQPPQVSPLAAQYPPNVMMQPGQRYVPAQQAQLLNPQSMVAARSSMFYSQQMLSPLQHQQQQQQQQSAAHNIGMGSGGTGGYNMLHADGALSGNSMLNAGVFPDYGRGGGGAKQEGGISLSVNAHGANSGGQSSDTAEPSYVRGHDDEGN